MKQTILKLISKSEQYPKKIEIFSQKLVKENQNFIQMLELLGINQVNFTATGNSIAMGYSLSDIIKPLLLRNTSLKKQTEEHGIELDYYNFARCQNSNEEHLLGWIYRNTKQSELNYYNHVDLNGGINSMPRSGITDEEIDIYYPLPPKKDKGLQDIIMQKSPNTANILVHSGCTSSFLDDIDRKGPINLKGFERDFANMGTLLNYVYFNNPTTQVYVVGIPYLFNKDVVFFYNKRIQEICSQYINVTYVTPAPAHVFYNKNGKLVVDIHHNQSEYLNLNHNIMASINDNYIQNMMKTEIEEYLYATSHSNQFYTPELKNDAISIDKNISRIISKYKPLLASQGKDVDAVAQSFISYYKARYSHDYYYTPKKETIDIISKKR